MIVFENLPQCEKIKTSWTQEEEAQRGNNQAEATQGAGATTSFFKVTFMFFFVLFFITS